MPRPFTTTITLHPTLRLFLAQIEREPEAYEYQRERERGMFASRRESIYGPTGAFCFAGFFLFSLMIPTLAVSFFFFFESGGKIRAGHGWYTNSGTSNRYGYSYGIPGDSVLQHIAATMEEVTEAGSAAGIRCIHAATAQLPLLSIITQSVPHSFMHSFFSINNARQRTSTTATVTTAAPIISPHPALRIPPPRSPPSSRPPRPLKHRSVHPPHTMHPNSSRSSQRRAGLDLPRARAATP